MMYQSRCLEEVEEVNVRSFLLELLGLEQILWEWTI